MSGISSSVSSAVAQANQGVGDRMGVTLLKQTLDHAKLEGKAAVTLIESAGEVSKGSSRASESGLGRGVDVSG